MVAFNVTFIKFTVDFFGVRISKVMENLYFLMVKNIIAIYCDK